MNTQNIINMVKTRRLYSDGFYKAFIALPYGQIREAREKIIKECSWSRSTFDKKMRGLTPFSNLEVKFLEEFFREYGIDAWTGQNIKK